MKTYRDLGTNCKVVVSFTPLPLYPRGKSPIYPLARRPGGPQSRSGRHGKRKILDPARSQLLSRLLAYEIYIYSIYLTNQISLSMKQGPS
jgi:hypothetical protein